MAGLFGSATGSSYGSGDGSYDGGSYAPEPEPGAGSVSEEPVADTGMETESVPEPDVESGSDDVKPESKSKGSSRKSKSRSTVVVSKQFVQNVFDVEKVLDDPDGLKLVQDVTGSRSEDKALLVARLSEKKVRNRVASLSDSLSGLQGKTGFEVVASLATSFADEKRDRDFKVSMRELIFDVLSLCGVDAGSPSGDAQKDAISIGSVWNDEVDVSKVRILEL